MKGNPDKKDEISDIIKRIGNNYVRLTVGGAGIGCLLAIFGDSLTDTIQKGYSLYQPISMGISATLIGLTSSLCYKLYSEVNSDIHKIKKYYKNNEVKD